KTINIVDGIYKENHCCLQPMHSVQIKAMELKLAKKDYEEITPRSFQRYDILPDDALRLIFSKTSFVDHIRLKLVCKSWKKLLDGGDIRCASILPWIMFYRWQPVDGDEGLFEFLCKLYDPSHCKTYTLEDGITKRGLETTHKYHVGAGILDSKRDSISLCRRGDRAWKTIQVLDNITESYFLKGVAYSNGSFYCLFEYGQLGAFNVATEQWDLLLSEKWQCCEYLFESDGQLFSVQITTEYIYMISRFDFSSRNWVQGVSPEHLAAFTKAGRTTCQSMLIPAVGEATQLAGTLNTFYLILGLQHYSFKSSKHLPLLDAYSKATISPADKMYDKTQNCSNEVTGRI
ncbi:hypothetical protein Tsubulata_024367, partial [Turnera subulata]